MLNPAISKRLERLLALHKQGVFNTFELGYQISQLVTVDNIPDVIPLMPAEAIEPFKSALAIGSRRLVDDEHLVPEGSPFADAPIGLCYWRQVAESLFSSREPSRWDHATVTCLPSFETEWAVRLGEPTRKCHSVLLVEAERQIWGQMCAGSAERVPVRQMEVAIPDALSNAICEAWRKLLTRTAHAREPSLGLDGVRYHFTFRGPAGWLAGQTWSPAPDSAPGHLVTVSRLLRDYARAEKTEHDSLTDRLRTELEWFNTLEG